MPETILLSEQIQQATDALNQARLLKKNAKTPEQERVADQLLIPALRAYKLLVPVEPRPLRPEAGPTVEEAVATNKADREQAREAEVADYLEPEMQRLLANQQLRAIAIREIRLHVAWLNQAIANIHTNQPVIAVTFIEQVIATLKANERALLDATVAPEQSKRKKKGG